MKTTKDVMKLLVYGFFVLVTLTSAFASCNEDKSVCSSTPEKVVYEYHGGMISSIEANGLKRPDIKPVVIQLPEDYKISYYGYMVCSPTIFVEWKQ